MLRLWRAGKVTPCGVLTKWPHGVPVGLRRFSSTTARLSAAPRIYTAGFPSVLPDVDKEVGLYSFMRKRWMAADPRKPALIQAETGQQITYGELIGYTTAVSHFLYASGVRRGDVVSVAMLNSVLYAPLCYGILGIGAIVSTVNVVGAPSTLAYHFKTNKCKVVLGQKFFQKAIETAAEIVKRETGLSLKVLYPEDFMKALPRDLAKMSMPTDYDAEKDAKPNDTVFIPFSSGTTGMPKGVQLTNRSLIANMEQVHQTFHTTDSEVGISVLPFFHVFGFTCSLNCLMTSHATQIVMMKYTVEAFVDAVEKYRVTMVPVAPPILVSLIKNHDTLAKRDLSSLQMIRSGSAPLSPELERVCEQLFPGASVAQGYGMTEMSPVVAAVPRGEVGGDRIYGSAGKLVADTELRIVKVEDHQQSGADKSSGIDCAPGEYGEIWFRGPQMMKGYLNEEDTAATMQDGWYRTGDIGYYEEKTGQLVVTDRLKELIKYKGFQVSPASIEALILQHPWVQDCLVVGVPDQRDVSFENPRALIVLKSELSAKEALAASDVIYRYVMARNPPHKRLHGGVRVVDVIPRNEAGKVLRRQVRQEEIAYVKAHEGGEDFAV